MEAEEVFDAALFDLFGTLVDERGDPVEGARDLLQSLPQSRWAIVTSCPRGLANALLARARFPEPQFIATADDVTRGKPAPDGYLLAAERLSAPPEACLVIEDSRQGIAAGIAAGMTVVGIGHEIARLRDLMLDVDPRSGRLRLRR